MKMTTLNHKGKKLGIPIKDIVSLSEIRPNDANGNFSGTVVEIIKPHTAGPFYYTVSDDYDVLVTRINKS